MKSHFSTLLYLFFLASLALAAAGMFAGGEKVPVDRLIRNVESQAKRTPNTPEVVYTLGRLHSLAFAQGEKEIFVSYPPSNPPYPAANPQEERKMPRFSPFSIPQVRPDATFNSRKAQAVSHLKMSLSLYHKAIELKPKEALYLFSYGWMLEQSVPLAAEVNAPFLAKPGKATKAAWHNEALKFYRRAFEASREQDLKRDHILQGMDFVVSLEAGQMILDAYKSRTLSAAETEEKTRIETQIKKINALPRAITPLIFPLNGQQGLAELTQNKTATRFNLSAEAKPRLWNWVTPETGILVYDPKQTGVITSGKQLFGSVTWWIFWENGFEPLAALDDDKDGWLEGRELAGIAVWQDKNSNGCSDPGEVVPVQKWGVQRIAVRPVGVQDGVLSHPQGVVLQDGTTRPLYDWTPHSLPETR